MEKKRIERSGRALRTEIEDRKRAKFGKAVRRKLSELEISILTNQIKKKIEIEEVRRNLEKRQKTRSKLSLEEEKILEEEWRKIEESLSSIISLERWVTARMLEESTLEEKRCIIFTGNEFNDTMQQDRRTYKYKYNHIEDKPEVGAEDEDFKEDFVESDIDAISERVMFDKNEVKLEFEFGRKKNNANKSEVQEDREEKE